MKNAASCRAENAFKAIKNNCVIFPKRICSPTPRRRASRHGSRDARERSYYGMKSNRGLSWITPKLVFEVAVTGYAIVIVFTLRNEEFPCLLARLCLFKSLTVFPQFHLALMKAGKGADLIL